MSFDRENMLLLLLSIRHSNASFFVSQHLSYGFVGDLCEEAIRKGFLIESRKELQLTKRGLEFIEDTNNSLGRKGMSRSISYLPDVTIKKASADKVYLPKKI